LHRFTSVLFVQLHAKFNINRFSEYSDINTVSVILVDPVY
jgi:hypothetical protein